MLFSVVIPLFNSAATVQTTVASVLAQDEPDFEVILVNDGSNDASLAVARSLQDARLRVIDKPHTGVSDTRNVGCRAARGRYLAFLDADDFWFPDHLSEARAFFAAHPEIEWYGAGQFHFPSGTPLPQDRGARRFEVRSFFRDAGSPVNSSNLILSRRLYEEGGGYPVELAHYEDWIFQCTLAKDHPLIGTNARITSVYWRYPGTATSRRPQNLDELFERIAGLVRAAVVRDGLGTLVYPRWVFAEYLKSLLFVRDEKLVLAKIDDYAALAGPAWTARWRAFVRRAYRTAGPLLGTPELARFVETAPKQRLKMAMSVLKVHGVRAALRWLALVVGYGRRGLKDQREMRKLAQAARRGRPACAS